MVREMLDRVHSPGEKFELEGRGFEPPAPVSASIFEQRKRKEKVDPS